MANDMNCVNIVGRLTKNCELKSTPNGTSVTRVSIAVNKKDAVNYFNVVIWDKLAENLAQYLTKGRQIAVTGELKQSIYKDKNNVEQSRVEITAFSVELLAAPKSENETKAPAGKTAAAPTPAPAQADDCGPESFEDSDIPF